MLKNRKGFTLVELLVVVAIIGLLSTLAVVALGNARQKARDAKRVSDIKQIQTGLELFFSDNNSYPAVAAKIDPLGGGGMQLTSGGGFGGPAGTTYMSTVPANPTPGGLSYTYTSNNADAGATACAAVPCQAYKITFTLESPVGILLAGPHTATPAGIN